MFVYSSPKVYYVILCFVLICSFHRLGIRKIKSLVLDIWYGWRYAPYLVRDAINIYNTDANVVYYLKTSSSNWQKSLEIDEVYAEKIKVKVFVNQQSSVS